MKRLFLLLVLLLTAVPLTAAFKKPYFANTMPGTWAKYDVRDTHNNHAYSMTYRRLADDGNLLGVEIQADFPASSPGGPMSSITRYAVASTFGWDKNAITFPRYAKSIEAGVAGGEMSPLPPQAIEMVTKEVTDYAASSTFKATETVGGKQLDHYTYSFKAPSGSTESGDLWLSDQVPFGIVKQTATMKDAEGKTTAKMEYTLTDSGKGKAEAPAKVAIAAEAAPVSLADALTKELVAADVVVLPDQRLRFTLGNKTDKAVKVKLPKGTITLTVSDPVGELKLVIAAERIVDVPAEGEAEPFEVKQAGARGPVEGEFRLSAYEGEPLFFGSVTMGTLEKK